MQLLVLINTNQVFDQIVQHSLKHRHNVCLNNAIKLVMRQSTLNALGDKAFRIEQSFSKVPIDAIWNCSFTDKKATLNQQLNGTIAEV